MAHHTGIDLAVALPHPPIFIEGIGSAADHTEAKASLDAFVRAAEKVVAADPEVLVIATPHGNTYGDCFNISPGRGAKGDWRSFGRDPVRYEASFDEAFAGALRQAAELAGIPCIESVEPVLDHGVMVPLHFLIAAGLQLGRCKLVRISISFLDEAAHYKLGCCVQQVAAASGRTAVFVASGDLSHRLKHDGPYGYASEGPAFDKAVAEAFAAGDFARFFSFEKGFRDKAAECGLNSFLVMAGVFDGYDVRAQLYSYEGPWGVGYGIASFNRAEPNEARRFA